MPVLNEHIPANLPSRKRHLCIKAKISKGKMGKNSSSNFVREFLIINRFLPVRWNRKRLSWTHQGHRTTEHHLERLRIGEGRKLRSGTASRFCFQDQAISKGQKKLEKTKKCREIETRLNEQEARAQYRVTEANCGNWKCIFKHSGSGRLYRIKKQKWDGTDPRIIYVPSSQAGFVLLHEEPSCPTSFARVTVHRETRRDAMKFKKKSKNGAKRRWAERISIFCTWMLERGTPVRGRRESDSGWDQPWRRSSCPTSGTLVSRFPSALIRWFSLKKSITHRPHFSSRVSSPTNNNHNFMFMRGDTWAIELCSSLNAGTSHSPFFIEQFKFTSQFNDFYTSHSRHYCALDKIQTSFVCSLILMAFRHLSKASRSIWAQRHNYLLFPSILTPSSWTRKLETLPIDPKRITRSLKLRWLGKCTWKLVQGMPALDKRVSTVDQKWQCRHATFRSSWTLVSRLRPALWVNQLER